eukprot:3704518-Rhodomonas_salina.1
MTHFNLQCHWKHTWTPLKTAKGGSRSNQVGEISPRYVYNGQCSTNNGNLQILQAASKNGGRTAVEESQGEGKKPSGKRRGRREKTHITVKVEQRRSTRVESRKDKDEVRIEKQKGGGERE